MGTSVGLPRMHRERGERRDFLPKLVEVLARLGAGEVAIEEGYGSGMGFEPAAYVHEGSVGRWAPREECFEQDLVLVLRCPPEEDLRRMRPGSMLLSMLHYATRPERTRLLRELELQAVSLDSVTDDRGRRLVENMELVAWTGVAAAFREIARLHPHFEHPGRRPLRVTCLGSGRVGGFAAHAATRYGDPQLREDLVARRVPGVEVAIADFDLTWHEDYMLERLASTDLLIDATQRRDPSRPVIPNRWVGALPEDAVILDLAVDPVDLDAVPPKTKGIEGIPTGDLERYVFAPDDPAYGRMDPREDASHRRVVVSCHAWPGVRPRASMEIYGEQLERVLEVILSTPVDAWDIERGEHRERAVARAELERWTRRHGR